jgi:hypothetical protein
MVTFLSELNGMELWATDIGNAYLEAYTAEKLFIVAGPEFGKLKGHMLIISKALYGLRFSGLRWHERFSQCLREMGFEPCKAEPDIWMRRVDNLYEYIREGKSPDDKKNSAFSTKIFANFHYFCVLFPSSRWNSTKPQHLSMRHYIAKKLSGIIFYILRQSHVMPQLVLLNLVVIHIIIVVTHETIDGQPGRQYIITFGLAYGSGQPFSLAHSTT